MATLRVRNIDDRLYEFLRETAKQRHRSISQEAVHILKNYFSQSGHPERGDSFLTCCS